MLNDNDLNTTFRLIANAGFNVVRTWAFNDVCQKPAVGTYFQVSRKSQRFRLTVIHRFWKMDKRLLTEALTACNGWIKSSIPPRSTISSSFSLSRTTGTHKSRSLLLRLTVEPLSRGFLSNDYGTYTHTYQTIADDDMTFRGDGHVRAQLSTRRPILHGPDDYRSVQELHLQSRATLCQLANSSRLGTCRRPAL